MVEFAGQTVGHYTDNKDVVCMLGGGSRQPKLQKLAMSFFLVLRKYKIVLHPVWISRESEIESVNRRIMKDASRLMINWHLNLKNPN